MSNDMCIIVNNGVTTDRTSLAEYHLCLCRLYLSIMCISFHKLFIQDLFFILLTGRDSWKIVINISKLVHVQFIFNTDRKKEL